MLRRKVSHSTTAGGVPAPLTDEHDPVWQSAEATAAFLARIGLEIAARDLNAGPVTRCVAAGRAWAWAAGITRPVSWGKSGVALDLTRMRELGLRINGSARERLRRINTG